MKWFKFEPQEEEATETETSPTLVYLSPEALKHTYVVDDFNSFQDTPECVPGGRIFEVSRQYSYKLRQVADLVEEPLEDENLNIKSSQKRNFHQEIKPDREIHKMNQEISDTSEIKKSFQDSNLLELPENNNENFSSQDKVHPDQVPFKDLESLFAK